MRKNTWCTWWMDLAEMIVDVARRRHLEDRVAETGGTVLRLEGDEGEPSVEYFVVRDGGDTYVWYPYVRGGARFRMRVDSRNLPTAYLASTTMLTTFLADRAPESVRVTARRAAEPGVLMYDRRASASHPDLHRCVREAFFVALSGA